MTFTAKKDKISIKKPLFYLLNHHFYPRNHDIRHNLLILQREVNTSPCMPGKCIYIESKRPADFDVCGLSSFIYSHSIVEGGFEEMS